MRIGHSVGDVVVEPMKGGMAHYLILMEWADHSGQGAAFEVVRMIPSCPPRYIYERWTIRKLDHRARLPDITARHVRELATRIWVQVRERYAGLGRSQRIHYPAETVELVEPGLWWRQHPPIYDGDHPGARKWTTAEIEQISTE